MTKRLCMLVSLALSVAAPAFAQQRDDRPFDQSRVPARLTALGRGAVDSTEAKAGCWWAWTFEDGLTQITCPSPLSPYGSNWRRRCVDPVKPIPVLKDGLETRCVEAAATQVQKKDSMWADPVGWFGGGFSKPLGHELAVEAWFPFAHHPTEVIVAAAVNLDGTVKLSFGYGADAEGGLLSIDARGFAYAVTPAGGRFGQGVEGGIGIGTHPVHMRFGVGWAALSSDAGPKKRGLSWSVSLLLGPIR